MLFYRQGRAGKIHQRQKFSGYVGKLADAPGGTLQNGIALPNLTDFGKQLVKDTQTATPAREILCVDDDADTCELLQFILHGYEFTAAHSIEKAFQLIESRPFGLYIFDNWLPGGTGVELCAKVRTLRIDAPIIFVSGVAHEKDVQDALSNGATRYLTKPCEPDLLKKVVKELIG
jgi:CheY-like chemotaxis protein